MAGSGVVVDSSIKLLKAIDSAVAAEPLTSKVDKVERVKTQIPRVLSIFLNF